MDNHDNRRSIVPGLVGGFLATLPMSLAMTWMHRCLPARERYPLPPSEITDQLTKTAGVDHKLNHSEHVGLTLLAHFGYGATAGAIYSSVLKGIPVHPLARGVGYGLAVWSGSYLGLLPALGILKSATEHPPRRNGLMIAAHVVWGAALGLIAERLESGPKHRKPSLTWERRHPAGRFGSP